MNLYLLSAIVAWLILIPVIILFGRPFSKRYLGLGTNAAYIHIFFILIAPVAAGLYREKVFQQKGEKWPEQAAILGAAYLVLFAMPLAIKLYRAWVGLYSTDEERLPGGAGVRAWLSPINLVLAVMTSVSAVFALNAPFLMTFCIITLIIIAFPVMNSLQSPEVAESRGSSSAERYKVLAMIESGKINAAEGSELLNALSTGGVASQSNRSVLGKHRMTLVGSILVLVGFFVPWFTVDPAAELARLSNSMGMDFPPAGGLLGLPVAWKSVNIAGGDVGHGLGWVVLGLGLVAAGIPFLGEEFEPRTQRKLSLIALGVGGIILLYLISNHYRHLNVGILVVIAGYALESLGSIKRRDWGRP